LITRKRHVPPWRFPFAAMIARRAGGEREAEPPVPWWATRFRACMVQISRWVAMVAWLVAALDILGLLAPAAAALDSLAITIGTLRLSVLLIIKAGLMISILLWAALGLARLISARIHRVTALSPSVQVLTGNLNKAQRKQPAYGSINGTT
jgi:small-conductance mechanosensitive channel